MRQASFEDQRFAKEDFTENALPQGDYDGCEFQSCDFSKADLSDIRFSDCKFEDCNLSLANLANTALQDVKFKDCKMLGLHFENCNEFGLSVSFEGCLLDHSSFYRVKLKKTVFKLGHLHAVDFTESDLTGSVFDQCDLTAATFENTILEKADFRTSLNFSINPEKNRIRKAKFSLFGLSGLLQKYDIVIER